MHIFMFPLSCYEALPLLTNIIKCYRVDKNKELYHCYLNIYNLVMNGKT